MKRKIVQTVQLYMQQHMSLYIFVIVLFAMGVIFGAILVHSLSLSQKEDLYQHLNQFFTLLSNGNQVNPDVSFQHSFGEYLKYVGFMWILGLSIIGLPLILILLFLKGLVVGFTIGFLVNQMKWEGLYFALVSVVPQNILVIPAMIIVGVAGISFSIRLIRGRLLRRGERIFPYFVSYSLLVLAMTVVLVGASVFEAYISPVLMDHVVRVMI